MRLRSRMLWVLVVVGLWFVVPSQVAPEARVDLGHELVERWLLGTESPLPKLVRDGELPALEVELRTSPPITDYDQLRSHALDYRDSSWEWAIAAGVRANTSESGGWPFLVRIGEHGVQAELPLPDGSVARFVSAHPTRWVLLPMFVAAALVLLGVPTLAWLLACVASTFAVLFATALPGDWRTALVGMANYALTSLILVEALMLAVLSLDWRIPARKQPGAWQKLPPMFVGFVVVAAGQRELEFARFVQHVGPLAWLPLVAIAAVCSLAATFCWTWRSHAAALLPVIPLVPKPLLGGFLLIYAFYIRLGRRHVIQPL